MSDEPRVSKEDYDSVYAAMSAMEKRGWRKATLNQQVEAWSCLVKEVEQGYGMTVDDYTNDLAVREWLSQVRGMLTPLLQESLDQRLEPLDERFRAATEEPASHLPGAGEHWFSRLPRVLVGELATDAERMSLIPRRAPSSSGDAQ